MASDCTLTDDSDGSDLEDESQSEGSQSPESLKVIALSGEVVQEVRGTNRKSRPQERRRMLAFTFRADRKQTLDTDATMRACLMLRRSSPARWTPGFCRSRALRWSWRGVWGEPSPCQGADSGGPPSLRAVGTVVPPASLCLWVWVWLLEVVSFGAHL